jgi:hypothetical protein
LLAFGETKALDRKTKSDMNSSTSGWLVLTRKSLAGSHPQNDRPNSQKPYDASSASFTTSKKFATGMEGAAVLNPVKGLALETGWCSGTRLTPDLNT